MRKYLSQFKKIRVPQLYDGKGDPELDVKVCA